MSVAWIFLAVILGVAIGWSWVHSTVARECERLGSFYVGSKTYYCSRVEDTNADRAGTPPPPGHEQKPPSPQSSES